MFHITILGKHYWTLTKAFLQQKIHLQISLTSFSDFVPLVSESEASDVNRKHLLRVLEVVMKGGDEMTGDVIVDLPLVPFRNLVPSSCPHWSNRGMVAHLRDISESLFLAHVLHYLGFTD